MCHWADAHQSGGTDPKLNCFGKINFRIQQILSWWKKNDPPPTRVKPIPLPVLQLAASTCQLMNAQESTTAADMIIIACFFLLRPGEFIFTDSPEATLFCLGSVLLFVEQIRLNIILATKEELWQLPLLD